MGASPHPHNPLGDFLRARRAQLSPREVGLPDTGGRRKVAGLRREEVAQLAAISVDYLTRLEQGRVQASGPVLVTLSRALHADWEHDARLVVASLRREAAKDPADPELATMVGALSLLDRDFATLWAAHQVSGAGYGVKHYRHPLVGDLTLDCDTWDSPDGSGQRLMILSAEPGTPSCERLRILLSWNATAQSQRLAGPTGLAD